RIPRRAQSRALCTMSGSVAGKVTCSAPVAVLPAASWAVIVNVWGPTDTLDRSRATLNAPVSALIIIHPEIIPPGARGQGRHRSHAGVRDELHVAVGEEEVGAAWVQAPEVEHVALVVEPAGSVLIRPRRAWRHPGWQHVPLGDAQEHV